MDKKPPQALDEASDHARGEPGVSVMRIYALGRARVERNGSPVDSPDWIQKPRELLYYLLSHPEGRTKEQVGLALWPGVSTGQLRSSFHDTVFRLRRALGDKRWIFFHKGQYFFGSSLDYFYDVEAFEKNVEEARRLLTEAPDEAVRHLREAADLYGGDYLEDLTACGEWAFVRREKLRGAYAQAQQLLGDLLLDRGRHAEAADAYGRIIARESFNEAANRGLMRCYALMGERARALAVYRAFAEVLREELGTVPGPETRALYDELQDEPDATPSVEPPRALGAKLNNLPLPPTPLVGREREIGEIAELLRGERPRLLTLTGPGGTGKTRVALAVGTRLLEGFDDGVYFVALAAVNDPGLVASAIAECLGVKESAEVSLTDTLKGYLQHKRLLLILDNFEQVLEGAPVVVELLRFCPGLRIVVTSRTSLRIYGEQEYSVPPLAVPDSKSLPSLEDLRRYEAVELFVERARTVEAGFSVTEENAPAVAEICARLDGLPLAIELAAARVRLLAPQAMLARLDNRLKLLSGGPRDLPARQRTLRGTIDWSYDLLEERDKTLFARIAVFAGANTLEAIEEVCDPEGGLDALDGVASLLEKSLLKREVDQGGEAHFDVLETVHEYASERLEESGEAEEIGRAHAEYFLALAEAAGAELQGPDQLQGMQRLKSAHDDMRAALGWALRRGETELVLRLGGALWWFWFVRGHYSEGRRWLEEGLAMEGRSTLESRAMALAGVGALAYEQDELDRAEEACEEGLALLANLATEPSEARLYLLLSLGHVALDREDYARATGLLEQCLALSRRTGHGLGLAGSIMSLATVTREQGDLERAIGLLEESMDIFRERGDKLGLSWCLINLGLVVCAQGDTRRAARLTEEGIALLRELGAESDSAIGLCNLGWMALLLGDLGRAASSYEESLDLAWDTGLHPIVLTTLEGYACLAGARGEARRAALLWSAAQALQQALAIPRDTDWLAVADARMSAVRSALGEQAWEEVARKGRDLTLEEAVAVARERGASGEPATVG